MAYIPDQLRLIGRLYEAAYPQKTDYHHIGSTVEQVIADWTSERAGEDTPRMRLQYAISALDALDFEQLYEFVMFGRDCSETDVEPPGVWMRRYVRRTGNRSACEGYLAAKPIAKYLDRADEMMSRFATQGNYAADPYLVDEDDQAYS